MTFSIISISLLFLIIININLFVCFDIYKTNVSHSYERYLSISRLIILESSNKKYVLNPNHYREVNITIFSTVESESSILNKTIQWYSLLQKKNGIQFVIFTKSRQISSYAGEYFTIIRSYSENDYGLPIINSLFYDIRRLFLKPTIDIVLNYLMTEVEKKNLPELHEIVGRVSVINEKELPTQFKGFEDLNALFQVQSNMRNDWSADYFILSKKCVDYLISQSIKIVIARQDVDNYMMAIANSALGNRLLLDGTDVVKGLHIGLGTHNTTTKFKTDEDKLWNVYQMKKHSVKKWSVKCKGNSVIDYSNRGYSIRPVLNNVKFC